jgi:Fe-S oxidoreductase
MNLTRTGDLGVYRAPRTLLNAIPGIKLVEMDRVKGWAFCCGNGAGVAEVNPGLLESTSGNRMTEAQMTGADALVTACPLCERALAAADGMKVVDLLDLVLDHME